MICDIRKGKFFVELHVINYKKLRKESFNNEKDKLRMLLSVLDHVTDGVDE